MAPVTVQVQDANGNLETTATNAITLALAANPGGSTLGGTLTVNAINGVATFSDLTLNQLGNGYTLSASAPGLTGATSTAFNIIAGRAGTIGLPGATEHHRRRHHHHSGGDRAGAGCERQPGLHGDQYHYPGARGESGRRHAGRHIDSECRERRGHLQQSDAESSRHRL